MSQQNFFYQAFEAFVDRKGKWKIFGNSISKIIFMDAKALNNFVTQSKTWYMDYDLELGSGLEKWVILGHHHRWGYYLFEAKCDMNDFDKNCGGEFHIYEKMDDYFWKGLNEEYRDILREQGILDYYDEKSVDVYQYGYKYMENEIDNYRNLKNEEKEKFFMDV